MNQQKTIISIIAAILLALVLSFNACTRSSIFSQPSTTKNNSGTVVGNPKMSVGDVIVDSVCTVIHRCNGTVTKEQCRDEFSRTNGANIPLGLSSDYATLQSISDAEKAGILTSQSSLNDECSSDISQLSCDNSLVQKSYLPASENPFSGAVNLISGSACTRAVAPVAKYSCSNKVFLRNANNPGVSPAVSSSGLIYSISPALPDGLTLNATTGEISGSPTTLTPLTPYTVTATASGGTATFTIHLKTADGYLVDDLSDAHNVGPGCATASGKCTLRAALESSAPSSPAKVIILPAGQINLTLGEELSLNSATEIYGDCAAGTTIDGLSATRVLHLTAGPTRLQNLVLQNGVHPDGGAGLWIDGSASGFNVDLLDLVVQNNSSSGLSGGGGIAINSSGMANTVIVSMERCQIQNNSSLQDIGGGLDIGSNTELTMKDCTVKNNSATTGGGMVVNGIATITQSVFQNNTALAGKGGAIYCASNLTGSRQVNLTNVTLADNTADRGGGIVFANEGIVSVVNSTIVNNRSLAATYGGGITSNGGGGSLSIKNSIIANNQSADTPLNCGANVSIQSLGFNLSDNNDCALNAAGDLQNVDPQLGPLQNNGGFTETLALLPGSPAISGISPATLCPANDQRNVARSMNGSCDIGAFEVP